MKKEYVSPMCEVLRFEIKENLMDVNLGGPSVEEGEEDW